MHTADFVFIYAFKIYAFNNSEHAHFHQKYMLRIQYMHTLHPSTLGICQYITVFFLYLILNCKIDILQILSLPTIIIYLKIVYE